MDDKITFMWDGCIYELSADGYRPISRLVDFIRKMSSEYDYQFTTNRSRFLNIEDYLKEFE